MNNNLTPINPESGNNAGVLGEILDVIGTQPPSAEGESKAPGRWEPQALRPRHREIMRRLLEGASYVAIAEALGITPQSIMLVATSKMFREELQKMEAELDYRVQQRAEDLSNEAFDKLKVLMRKARSEMLQASCAEKILGIAGYSKIEKKLVGIVSGEEVIKELNKRRREQILGSNGSTTRDSGQRSDGAEAPDPASISLEP